MSRKFPLISTSNNLNHNIIKIAGKNVNLHEHLPVTIHRAIAKVYDEEDEDVDKSSVAVFIN